MKNCPKCGWSAAEPKKPGSALEIEIGDAHEPDEDTSVKDELLAELMDELGASLASKFKKPAQA